MAREEVIFHFKQNIIFLLIGLTYLAPTITYLCDFLSLYWNPENSIQTNWHIYHPPESYLFLFLTRCKPHLGCPQSYPLNPSLITLGGHDPFFLWPPREPSWKLFPSLPQIVLFAWISISQRDVSSLVAMTIFCHCIPFLSTITVGSLNYWLTDRPLSLSYSLFPSTPLNSGVRRKKLDLCSVSWNPTVLVSSLMLVASLQRKTLFSFFWITSHQDYFL